MCTNVPRGVPIKLYLQNRRQAGFGPWAAVGQALGYRINSSQDLLPPGSMLCPKTHRITFGETAASTFPSTEEGSRQARGSSFLLPAFLGRRPSLSSLAVPILGGAVWEPGKGLGARAGLESGVPLHQHVDMEGALLSTI